MSVSATGLLALDANNTNDVRQFTWVDRAGKPLNNVGAPGVYQSFRLAPDEKRIILQRLDNQTHTSDLWLLDLTRGTELRFTFDPSNDFSPIWSATWAKSAKTC